MEVQNKKCLKRFQFNHFSDFSIGEDQNMTYDNIFLLSLLLPLEALHIGCHLAKHGFMMFLASTLAAGKF